MQSFLRRNKNEKGNTKQIIITVIAVIIGSTFGKLGVEYFFNRSSTFDEQMMKTASELNKTCPIMVDNDTRLDNVIALSDNVFQCNYTLVNYSKGELDIEKLEKNISTSILKNVKSNPSIKLYRGKKAAIACSYKNDVFPFSLEYKYNDYKK